MLTIHMVQQGDSEDVLTGSNGEDWFNAPDTTQKKDKVTDLVASEVDNVRAFLDS